MEAAAHSRGFVLRSLLALLGLLAPLLVLIALRGVGAAPAAAEFEGGAWSAPFSVPVIGIHSAVLPSGKVLLFSKPRNSAGSEAWLWDPDTGAAIPPSHHGCRSADPGRAMASQFRAAIR